MVSSVTVSSGVTVVVATVTVCSLVVASGWFLRCVVIDETVVTWRVVTGAVNYKNKYPSIVRAWFRKIYFPFNDDFP